MRRLQKALKSTEDMISESIDFIRKNEPPEGYYVGFSGGKDSIVTLDLVKKSGVKYQAFYACTGIDPPEIVQFIKANYPDIKFLYPEYSFFEGIKKKFPPLRLRRWCCDVLKKNPSKKIPLQNRIMGIRSEESAKRASRGSISKIGKQTICKPIFDFTEYHVWDYIEKNNLAYPEMYDEGFERIGCMICPFICGKNQARVNRNKKRFPKFFKAFEHSIKAWFDIHKSERYSEKTAAEYVAAYYRGFEDA